VLAVVLSDFCDTLYKGRYSVVKKVCMAFVCVRERESVCVWCVCERERVCVYVCVCVCPSFMLFTCSRSH
jgi:hypothetical protein